MKKATITLLTLCLGWICAAQAAEPAAPPKHPDSSAWDNLFKEDLSDATYPKGIWTYQNGELTASEDQCIWTTKEYENYIVDLEFKTAEASNSGVVVYCSDLQNWIPHSVEIQILDDYSQKWANVPKNWLCASIFGHLAPTKQTVKKPGEWNRMTVTCKGQMITVMLNGEVVTKCDMSKWTSAKKNPDGSDIPAWLSTPLAKLATKGHIGLQGKHGGAPIFFRNMKIKQID